MAFYTLAICTKIPKPQHSIPSTNRFIYFVVFFSSVFFLFASANIAPIASNMHFTWLPGIVASKPFRFLFFPPNSIDESNQIWYITAHTHFEIDSKPMEKHCMNMRADEMKHQRLSIHSKQVNAHRTHSHQPALAHFGTETDKPASKKIYHLIALYHWIWYWMMLMLLMMTVNVYHRSTVTEYCVHSPHSGPTALFLSFSAFACVNVWVRVFLAIAYTTNVMCVNVHNFFFPPIPSTVIAHGAPFTSQHAIIHLHTELKQFESRCWWCERLHKIFTIMIHGVRVCCVNEIGCRHRTHIGLGHCYVR